MTTTSVRLVSILAAAGLLAAACSSSGSGTPANPPPGGDGRQTSAPVRGGGSTALPPSTAAATAETLADVCTVLPPAALTQLTGVKFTKAEHQKMPATSAVVISSCNYTGAVGIQLDISATKTSFAPQLFQDDYSSNKQVINKTAMVSGIGDKAFTADFPSMWLEVLWGDEQLQVTGGTALTVATAKKVLTALHEKL